MFLILKTIYFQLWFLCKSDGAFILQENVLELSELNTFKPRKPQYFQHYLPDKGLIFEYRDITSKFAYRYFPVISYPYHCADYSLITYHYWKMQFIAF